ncbi:MAG: hypothetical protein R2822_08425 [Spirosomataceae bacterium]
MADLQLTDRHNTHDHRESYRSMRQHVIGVNSAPDALPVRVLLRLTHCKPNTYAHYHYTTAKRSCPKPRPIMWILSYLWS